MDDESRRNLDRVIKRMEEELENLTPGTDEYHHVIEDLEIMYKARTEDDRQNAEAWEKQERLRIEEAKSKSDKKFKVSEVLISLLHLGVGAASFFGVMKFEETGIIRSKAFNLVTRFMERKK